MATKRKRDDGAGREVPPALIVTAIVILVLAVGVGGYYAFNGGWKTAAMQDDAYKHEMLPIMAAKHGDTEALEAENKFRQAHGQPLLKLKEDKKATSQNSGDKLAEVRKRLGAQ